MLRRPLLLLALLALAACDTGTAPTMDEAGILAYLRETNVDGTGFPWTGAAAGRLKRWSVEAAPIPVQANGNALALEAMDRIEAELGRTLFDRTSLAGIPADSIEVGLIVSVGTAVGEGGAVNGNVCGQVSAEPGGTAWPAGFHDSEGRILTRLYVHISSSACSADLDVAIHEFGHALGMGEHFPGFGEGPAAGDNFWNVLHNLHANPVGATVAELQIERVR